MGISTSLDVLIRSIQDASLCLNDKEQPLESKGKAFSSTAELFQNTFTTSQEMDLSRKMESLSITPLASPALVLSDDGKLQKIFFSFTVLKEQAAKLHLPCSIPPFTLHSLFEKVQTLRERAETPSDVTCSSEQKYTPPLQEPSSLQACSLHEQKLLICCSIRELYEALDSCYPIQLPKETTYFILKNHGNQSLHTIMTVVQGLLEKELKKDPKTERPFEDLWIETLWKIDALKKDCYLDKDLEKLCKEVETKVTKELDFIQNPLPKLKWLFSIHMGDAILATKIKNPFPFFFSLLDKKEFKETTCEEVFQELIQNITYDEFKESIHPFELKMNVFFTTTFELQQPPFDVLSKSISRMIAQMKQTLVAKATDEVFNRFLKSTTKHINQEKRLDFSDHTFIVHVGNEGTKIVKKVFELVRRIDRGGFKIVELVKLINGLIPEEIGTLHAYAHSTKETTDRSKKDFSYEYEISEALKPYSVEMILSQVSLNEYTLMMPYFDLGALDKFARKLPNSHIQFTLAREIAENLLEIHKRHLLHLDIKPANILGIQEGRVTRTIISDYSFTKRTDPTTLLRSFSRMSPGFYPPEMFLSDYVPLTPRLDVFALGLTLYYLLNPMSTFYMINNALQYLFKKSIDKNFNPHEDSCANKLMQNLCSNGEDLKELYSKTCKPVSPQNNLQDLCSVTKFVICSFEKLQIIDKIAADQYISFLNDVQIDDDRPKIQYIYKELFFSSFRKKLKELYSFPKGSIAYLIGELLEEDPLKRKSLEVACEELRRLEQEELKRATTTR